jgi:hypothetical protein
MGALAGLVIMCTERDHHKRISMDTSNNSLDIHICFWCFKKHVWDIFDVDIEYLATCLL